MAALQVHYEGRVQGVGFRWTVKHLANGFDVTGTVRNLEDGRVELCVAGEPAELEAFLQAIAESELKGHIRTAERRTMEHGGWRGFQIAG